MNWQKLFPRGAASPSLEQLESRLVPSASPAVVPITSSTLDPPPAQFAADQFQVNVSQPTALGSAVGPTMGDTLPALQIGTDLAAVVSKLAHDFGDGPITGAGFAVDLAQIVTAPTPEKAGEAMTDFGADLVTTGLGGLLTGGAAGDSPVAKAGIDLGLDWYTSKVDAQVIADQATYVAGTQALWSTQIDAGLLSTPPAAFATAPTFNLDFPPQGLSDFGSSLWDSPTMGAFSPVPLDPSAFGTDFWSSCLPADPWGSGGMGDSNAFTVNFDPSSTWSSGGNLSSLTCSDLSPASWSGWNSGPSLDAYYATNW